MTDGSNLREVVEWARHRDVICLGILTISTAVTGAAVAAAANSPIPSEIREGNLNDFNLAWAVAGGLAAGSYLATILVTGATINMIPGSRIRDLDLKQIGLLLTHVPFAFEATLLVPDGEDPRVRVSRNANSSATGYAITRGDGRTFQATGAGRPPYRTTRWSRERLHPLRNGHERPRCQPELPFGLRLSHPYVGGIHRTGRRPVGNGLPAGRLHRHPFGR